MSHLATSPSPSPSRSLHRCLSDPRVTGSHSCSRSCSPSLQDEGVTFHAEDDHAMMRVQEEQHMPTFIQQFIHVDINREKDGHGHGEGDGDGDAPHPVATVVQQGSDKHNGVMQAHDTNSTIHIPEDPARLCPARDDPCDDPLGDAHVARKEPCMTPHDFPGDGGSGSLSSSSDSSLHGLPSHTHTRHISDIKHIIQHPQHFTAQPATCHFHQHGMGGPGPLNINQPTLSLSLSPQPMVIPQHGRDEDSLSSSSHSFSSHSSLHTPSVSQHKHTQLMRQHHIPSEERDGDDDMSVLGAIFKFHISFVVFKIFDCMDLCELLPLACINHTFCSHLNPLSSVLTNHSSTSQSISSTSSPWRTIPSWHAQPSVVSITPALTSISSKPTSPFHHPVPTHVQVGRIHAHAAHIYDGDDDSQQSTSGNALSSLSTNIVSTSPVNVRISTTTTHTFIPPTRPPPSPTSFLSQATRQPRTSHNQGAPLSSTASSSTSTSLPISPLYLSLSTIRRSYLSHRSEATLRHLPSLTSALLLFPCLHKLTTLNFLTPARFHVSDAILSLLSACPRLQHLDMSDCMRISDDGIKTLSSCHALQTLNLSYSRISSTGLSYLSTCSNLKKLNLKYCDLINDTGLKYLAQLPQLEVLNLSYCHRITSAGLTSICHCAKLKKINLSRCTRINDAGLRFASMCTQLEVIDLTACESLTGSGLEYLHNCIHLYKLDLSFCIQMTDIGLLFLSHTNIQYLSLQGCKRITDTGMSYLGEMSELRTLRLDGCQLITDTGLRCLAACTHLRVLDVYDTPSVTTLGVKKLANSFRNHSRTVNINR